MNAIQPAAQVNPDSPFFPLFLFLVILFGLLAAALLMRDYLRYRAAERITPESFAGQINNARAALRVARDQFVDDIDYVDARLEAALRDFAAVAK
jgi:hypothetical protein